MQYNKSNLTKTNEHKVLRKVKKHWVVLSMASFATAGGVMMENTVNARADTVDNNQTQTNSTTTATSTDPNSASASLSYKMGDANTSSTSDSNASSTAGSTTSSTASSTASSNASSNAVSTPNPNLVPGAQQASGTTPVHKYNDPTQQWTYDQTKINQNIANETNQTTLAKASHDGNLLANYDNTNINTNYSDQVFDDNMDDAQVQLAAKTAAYKAVFSYDPKTSTSMEVGYGHPIFLGDNVKTAYNKYFAQWLGTYAGYVFVGTGTNLDYTKLVDNAPEANEMHQAVQNGYNTGALDTTKSVDNQTAQQYGINVHNTMETLMTTANGDLNSNYIQGQLAKLPNGLHNKVNLAIDSITPANVSLAHDSFDFSRVLPGGTYAKDFQQTWATYYYGLYQKGWNAASMNASRDTLNDDFARRGWDDYKAALAKATQTSSTSQSSAGQSSAGQSSASQSNASSNASQSSASQSSASTNTLQSVAQSLMSQLQSQAASSSAESSAISSLADRATTVNNEYDITNAMGMGLVGRTNGRNYMASAGDGSKESAAANTALNSANAVLSSASSLSDDPIYQQLSSAINSLASQASTVDATRSSYYAGSSAFDSLYSSAQNTKDATSSAALSINQSAANNANTNANNYKSISDALTDALGTNKNNTTADSLVKNVKPQIDSLANSYSANQSTVSNAANAMNSADDGWKQYLSAGYKMSDMGLANQKTADAYAKAVSALGSGANDLNDLTNQFKAHQESLKSLAPAQAIADKLNNLIQSIGGSVNDTSAETAAMGDLSNFNVEDTTPDGSSEHSFIVNGHNSIADSDVHQSDLQNLDGHLLTLQDMMNKVKLNGAGINKLNEIAKAINNNKLLSDIASVSKEYSDSLPLNEVMKDGFTKANEARTAYSKRYSDIYNSINSKSSELNDLRGQYSDAVSSATEALSQLGDLAQSGGDISANDIELVKQGLDNALSSITTIKSKIDSINQSFSTDYVSNNISKVAGDVYYDMWNNAELIDKTSVQTGTQPSIQEDISTKLVALLPQVVSQQQAQSDQAAKDAQAKLDAVNQALTQANSQNTQAQAQINTANQATQAANDALAKAQADTKANADKLQAELDAANKATADAKAQADAAQQAANKQASDLQTKLDAALKAQQDAQSQTDDAKAKAKQNADALQSQLDAAIKAQQQAEADVQNAKQAGQDKVNDLQAQLDAAIKAQQAATAQNQKAQADAKSNADALQAKLDAAIKAQQAADKAAQDAKDASDKHDADLQSQIDRLQHALNDAKAANAKLTADSQKANADLQAQLDAAKADQQKANDQIKALTDVLAKTQADADKAKSDNQALQSALNNANHQATQTPVNPVDTDKPVNKSTNEKPHVDKPTANKPVQTPKHIKHTSVVKPHVDHQYNGVNEHFDARQKLPQTGQVDESHPAIALGLALIAMGMTMFGAGVKRRKDDK